MISLAPTFGDCLYILCCKLFFSCTLCYLWCCENMEDVSWHLMESALLRKLRRGPPQRSVIPPLRQRPRVWLHQRWRKPERESKRVRRWKTRPLKSCRAPNTAQTQSPWPGLFSRNRIRNAEHKSLSGGDVGQLSSSGKSNVISFGVTAALSQRGNQALAQQPALFSNDAFVSQRLR